MVLRLIIGLLLGGLISISLALNGFLLVPLDNKIKLAWIILLAIPVWSLVTLFILCDNRRLPRGILSWGAVFLLSAVINGVVW